MIITKNKTFFNVPKSCYCKKSMWYITEPDNFLLVMLLINSSNCTGKQWQHYGEMLRAWAEFLSGPSIWVKPRKIGIFFLVVKTDDFLRILSPVKCLTPLFHPENFEFGAATTGKIRHLYFTTCSLVYRSRYKIWQNYDKFVCGLNSTQVQPMCLNASWNYLGFLCKCVVAWLEPNKF